VSEVTDQNIKNILLETEQELSQSPENIELWIKKVNALVQLRLFEKAIETLLALSDRLANDAMKSKVLEMAVELSSDHSLYEYGYLCSKRFWELNKKSPKAAFFAGMFACHCSFPLESIARFSSVNPSFYKNSEFFNFYGRAYMQMGEPNLAIEHLSKCLEQEEVSSSALYKLLHAYLYSSDAEEVVVAKYHRLIAEKLSDSSSSCKVKDFCGVNRVGIISGDLYSHSVSFFAMPLFQALTDSDLELFVYSMTKLSKQDAVTKKLKKCANRWVDLESLSSIEAHKLIIDDSIDVLLDLSGSLGPFDPKIFQLRSAPVQISYIGYPHTTGLSEMDYRIVDANTDPEKMTDAYTYESLLRLPDCFLCYEPHIDAPPVSESPRLKKDCEGITFGSFNNFAKINPKVREVWASILNQVENSSLIIKAGPFHEEAFCEKIFLEFEAYGVDRSRLILISWTVSQRDHLKLYDRVDIHLDSFPYNGTTTTCEAAWQGVPTITYEGHSHRARVGFSLMRSIGLESFVGEDVQQYIKIAIEKASNLSELNDLRKSMRERMQASVLMDKHKYGKNIIDLMRQLNPR